ncbi:MAG: hypothetical protein JO111_00500 [Caulobacteraceae bacterium]|nr:hypothetical protein [Caulobacteraceae bacterium]
MRAIFFTFCVAFVASPVFAATATLNPAEEHSAQCFIVMISLTNSTDSSLQESGYVGSTFFAGQLFGADPNIDLASTIQTEVPRLTPEITKNLVAQCGAELVDKAKQITAARQILESNEGRKPSP